MRLLLALGLATFSAAAQASHWTAEAAVAFIEELSLACAKAEPESASKYEAKKNFLFSQNIEGIEKAQSSSIDPETREWARNTIREFRAETMEKECRSFLADAEATFKPADSPSSRQGARTAPAPSPD